jgi:hypothetical protein
VFVLLLVLACGGASDEDVSGAGVGLMSYSAGMWEQRALTLSAGINEAVKLAEEDQNTEAVALVEAIYTGSYEPELEIAIRNHLGAHVALELELEFGRLMKDIKNRKRRSDRAKVLAEQVRQAAAILESKAANLRLD